MTSIQHTLDNIKELFISSLDNTGYRINDNTQFNDPGWLNITWSADSFRKAHVNIIDATASKGLWMMHCCIYPHYSDTSPIFGFDIFAGKNKITGFFHDYSPLGEHKHELLEWFKHQADQLEWCKRRELPEWATRIFSNSIIAAGNVRSEVELDQIFYLIKESLSTYLQEIGTVATVDTIKYQQYYIENQRLNPHNPKVLMSLGLSNEDANLYIQTCLFPSV